MKNQGERGFVLISVMVLVIVVGMMASLAQGRSLTLAKDSVRQKGEAQALYAAEGGLAKARHALRSDADWKGAQLQVGACEVLVTVERVAEEQWRVVAKARAYPGGELGNPVQITLVEELGEEYRYRSLRR